MAHGWKLFTHIDHPMNISNAYKCICFELVWLIVLWIWSMYTYSTVAREINFHFDGVTHKMKERGVQAREGLNVPFMLAFALDVKSKVNIAPYLIVPCWLCIQINNEKNENGNWRDGNSFEWWISAVFIPLLWMLRLNANTNCDLKHAHTHHISVFCLIPNGLIQVSYLIQTIIFFSFILTLSLYPSLSPTRSLSIRNVKIWLNQHLHYAAQKWNKKLNLLGFMLFTKHIRRNFRRVNGKDENGSISKSNYFRNKRDMKC